MKSPVLKLCLTAALAFTVAGCPTPVATTCTTLTCANGCCSADGVCKTANDNATCGISGAACAVCSGSNACTASGVCMTALPPQDSGTAVADAGTVDAGNPCIDSPGDAVLGTFTAMNGASVMSSGPLPAGVIAITEVNGTLYGLTATRTIHRIGTFPALALGPAIAKVVPDSVDAGDDSLFLSGYLAATGTQLLAGYTQVGAGFPGQIALVETSDAGVQYFNAPGNFDAVGVNGAFVINGGGLGTLTGNGVYELRPTQATPGSLLTSFDSTFDVKASGNVDVTSSGILLVGYSRSSSFENYVHAIRSDTYTAALTAGTSFVFAPTTPVLVHGFDVSEINTLGDAALIVRGGYGANGPYTTSLQSVALTQTLGSDVVTIGATTELLHENGTQCTRIVFTGTSANTLYVALQDSRGKRLVKFNQ